MFGFRLRGFGFGSLGIPTVKGKELDPKPEPQSEPSGFRV